MCRAYHFLLSVLRTIRSNLVHCPFSCNHSSGIILCAHLNPFFSHHSKFLCLAPLFILALALLNTKRMSSSGCCLFISRCLRLSSGSNFPLVSIMIPLSSSKSGVYVRYRRSSHYIFSFS